MKLQTILSIIPTCDTVTITDTNGNIYITAAVADIVNSPAYREHKNKKVKNLSVGMLADIILKIE